MESDSERKKKNIVIERSELNVSYVLSTLWVRLFVQDDNGHKWFILGGRYMFLFYLWNVLFNIYTSLKEA